MKDYSKYPKSGVFYSGAERKCEIIINGYKYIVKFQRNSQIGLTYNHISEYIGSHIFQLVGIPAQETFQGVYHGENVVVLKNFLKDNERLVHFNDVGESTLEQDKERYHYTYDDIMAMLEDNKKNTEVEETIERFWEMFIVDALIGNFDRHGGNWGFIKSNDSYRMAPVYDNGSCLYPQLNSDEQILKVLQSEEERNKRIYTFPTSHIKQGNRKSSYYDIICSLQYEHCNQALKNITERLDFDKIYALVDETEGISQVRNEFYKTMLKLRYEKILLHSYNLLKGREK